MNNEEQFCVSHTFRTKLLTVLLHVVLLFVMSCVFLINYNKCTITSPKSYVMDLYFMCFCILFSYLSVFENFKLLKVKGRDITYKNIFYTTTFNCVEIKEKEIKFDYQRKNGAIRIILFNGTKLYLSMKMINVKRFWLYIGGKEEDFFFNHTITDKGDDFCVYYNPMILIFFLSVLGFCLRIGAEGLVSYFADVNKNLIAPLFWTLLCLFSLFFVLWIWSSKIKVKNNIMVYTI